MSEFELRVTPSVSPNGSVWFYDLAVERDGLRVESSLRAMDLEALYRSCERPVSDAGPAGVPMVVASRGRHGSFGDGCGQYACVVAGGRGAAPPVA